MLINMTNMDNNWGDGVKMYMTNYTIHSFQKDYPNTYSFCRSNALAFPRFPITIYENIIDERGQKPQFDSYDCQKVVTKTFLGQKKFSFEHWMVMR